MARCSLPSPPLGVVSSSARVLSGGRKRRIPPVARVACAAGFSTFRLGQWTLGRLPVPVLFPHIRKAVCQAAEGRGGDAVLQAARLSGSQVRMNAGVAEQPPEELVFVEGRAGDAQPPLREPHVAVDHLHERLGGEPRRAPWWRPGLKKPGRSAMSALRQHPRSARMTRIASR